jgi:hypothetical protein
MAATIKKKIPITNLEGGGCQTWMFQFEKRWFKKFKPWARRASKEIFRAFLSGVGVSHWCYN